jgi:hypothetical protein
MRSRLIAILLLAAASARGADDPPLPSSLSKDQQANLLEFLKANRTPERYVPKDAKVADAAPPAADLEIAATKDRPIKQYLAQITPHRPTPDQPQVGKADVYFYRPNPGKGKPGLTVKHTVDLATGKQVGETEVLTKAHTPVSREELAEAVAAVREKAAAVKALYKDRDEKAVRWEYLQMKINRKSEQFEPGDRVVRFVFTADPADGEPAPTPVRVLVNLTKDTVTQDDR